MRGFTVIHHDVREVAGACQRPYGEPSISKLPFAIMGLGGAYARGFAGDPRKLMLLLGRFLPVCRARFPPDDKFLGHMTCAKN